MTAAVAAVVAAEAKAAVAAGREVVGTVKGVAEAEAALWVAEMVKAAAEVAEETAAAAVVEGKVAADGAAVAVRTAAHWCTRTG